MHSKTSGFLPAAIIIGGALILLAALVIALSPMLWTDHVLVDVTRPLPSGCTMQTKSGGTAPGFIPVAHCPVWVQLPN
jgi:hypothetical protein